MPGRGLEDANPRVLSGPEAAASETAALRRLRDVFEQLPAAVCVLRGPDHVFEFTNAQYQALVAGRAVEGVSVAEALPEVVEQGFVDLLDNVYRTGERFIGQGVSAEIRRGNRLESIVVDFTFEPVRGADGAVEGILVQAVEVTDAVRYREELQEVLQREQEDRFRQAIDSMLDTVIIAGPVRDDAGVIVDLVVEFVNSGGDEVGKREREQLIGGRFKELWPNIEAQGLLTQYIDVLETGTPVVLDDYQYADEVGERAVDGFFDLRATKLADKLFLVFRDVTERVARERALAESRARLAREHEAVVMLQSALLPRELPAIPRTAVAAEYVAASDEVEVGGDWFDVFVLPDGSVAIAVGDVAGKGIEAAQTMAQVRTAGRVAALAGHDAAGVLTAQNALMLAAGIRPFATAVFALYNPGTGSFCWASAGHLPPIVVSDDYARLATLDPRPPLGVVEEPGYVMTRLTLAPGDRLVLYTDGLVERRDESISDGIERLRALVRSDGTPREACRRLLDVLAPGEHTDDVCVLTLDRVRQPSSELASRGAPGDGAPVA